MAMKLVAGAHAEGVRKSSLKIAVIIGAALELKTVPIELLLQMYYLELPPARPRGLHQGFGTDFETCAERAPELRT